MANNFNKHVKTAKDLETTYEETKIGFLSIALRKSIKLPVNSDGDLNVELMESYIKSLSFSSAL